MRKVLAASLLASSAASACMEVPLANDYGYTETFVRAIMKTESNCNRDAIGMAGERGLFQLKPQFHDMTDEQTSALKYLKQVEKRCVAIYGEAWFICYNTGPNAKKVKDPKKHPYYRKVMYHVKEGSSLKQ